jgi:phage-related minor tail protein
MREFGDITKSATRSMISDLIQGKSAAEAFGNVLGQIGNKLIDMGLDSLFSGFGSSGGAGRTLFPNANGGVAAYGRPRMFARGGVSRTAAIFGEAGPEAAVPLPDGRRIPVDLRMPTAAPGDGGAVTVPISINIDATGADAAAIARLERKLDTVVTELPGRIKQTIKQRGSHWT